jgi:hypothetical protein
MEPEKIPTFLGTQIVSFVGDKMQKLLSEGLKITAGFLGFECLDKDQEIWAYRFKEEYPEFMGCYVENFFVANLKLLRKLNLATKIIGTSILIFPKSD